MDFISTKFTLVRQFYVIPMKAAFIIFFFFTLTVLLLKLYFNNLNSVFAYIFIRFKIFLMSHCFNSIFTKKGDRLKKPDHILNARDS